MTEVSKAIAYHISTLLNTHAELKSTRVKIIIQFPLLEDSSLLKVSTSVVIKIKHAKGLILRIFKILLKFKVTSIYKVLNLKKK